MVRGYVDHGSTHPVRNHPPRVRVLRRAGMDPLRGLMVWAAIEMSARIVLVVYLYREELAWLWESSN